jgi:16S rRNA (guanine527-N7)-methyltransferase
MIIEKYNQEWFGALCKQNHLHLSEQMLSQLDLYQILLCEWNKKVNLISRKDEFNIWNKHFVGALSFLFHFRLEENCTILDLGTGGGLPGIPLAIVYPNSKIILIDSIRKKITAVKEIVTRLNLCNVRIESGRAEEIGLTMPHKGSTDYVITRAVSSITNIIKWSNPWLHHRRNSEMLRTGSGNQRTLIPRGSIILLKGGDIQKEIEVAKNILAGKIVIIKELTVDNVEEELMPNKKVIIIHN